MTAALLLGAGIGVMLGLFGGGGSLLAVPALLYGVGMPLSTAVPTSLLVVGVSSAAAVLPRLRFRQVQWRIAAVFGLAGAVSAFAGSVVNRLLDPQLVLLGFATLMVAAAIRMLREPPDAGGDCALPGGKVDWRRCLPKAIGAGAAVGFLTGLFGVGGGFLVIPALVLLLGLPMTVAVGTSLVVIVINSAAGFFAYLGDARLDYEVALAFTASAILGSLVAARVARRWPAERLRRWFALFVLAVATLVVVHVALDPSG
ncbi:MAG: sulfite exporter TauE/SafE family protein [Actinomycetes bacterium]